MCLPNRLRGKEGRSEPASVHHSPVARDYPSRALSGLFQAPCAATVSYRSHSGIAPAVAGWSLLSEASSPSSVAPCQGRRAGRGADTPASPVLRVGTVTTRTAPACGWPLAPRYGSDLLPLRLRSLCSWVIVFCTTAQSRRFDGICLSRSLPTTASPLRARTVSGGLGLLAGVFVPAGKRVCVLVCAVAAVTLWVTASDTRVETPRLPDSARTRFLVAPGRSAPESCHWTGHDTGQRSW
jgi:hypothetical protein